MAELKHRKATVTALAGGMLLTLLLLAALNAFNLRFLHPHSTGQIFLFTALSVLVFLLLVMLLVLLSRNILKLYADQRSRVLGSRLRSRMLIGALLLSFAPALFMFLFSYLLLNRSIERWFEQPVTELREDSTRIALELSHYAADNARAEAEALVGSTALQQSFRSGDMSTLLDEIRSHRITLQGGFAIVYRDGVVVTDYQIPAGKPAVHPWLEDTDTPGEAQAAANEPSSAVFLRAAQRSDEPVIAAGDRQYALGAASGPAGEVVVVGLPMPTGLSSTVKQIRDGTLAYWTVFRARNRVRSTYLLLLLLLTTLTFFASSWLALFLSKQVTRPVEALADAMDEIAEGHYQHRITLDSTEELGALIRSFNRMAADLEESRMVAESSTSQLSAANSALEERRRELETILETIPSGVVTLDAQLRVIQANHAFAYLLESSHEQLGGATLESLFPRDIVEELKHQVRRAQRMGVAATEFELPGTRGVLNLTATLALLDLGRNQRGCVLVVEDVTELLRAQRQTAWKEAAQRVAHEIKNPLTPIALSAERIRKHVDRSTAESPNVIRRCSEIILGSVETMSKLVDQFATLAQFPVAQPKPADLNQVVESSLMLFAGRLDGISIDRHLAPDIPPVMADAESLKRALANLIDNAAEAMQGSLLRQLTVETCVGANHLTAEIVLADTGHGLTDEMRERLFLPYFSTKQRGTGLGLAIAAKVVQDHRGAIRAERNHPAGAKFIIELPLAESNGNGNGNGNGHALESSSLRGNGTAT